ncbi:restriction endonuclease [Streptomyces sp. NPDC055952]|uniref:restriction endonuclease n=1 Tax=Streptomyces sp. NPDC055952 TaxID=3345663 RepID=UPI0035D6583A
MTAPVRPAPPAHRRYRFDLRSTALFFVFLAVVLVVAGLALRTLADAAERRPAWMFVLISLGVAALLSLRRRLRPAKVARRAAAALDEAAREAADALDAAPPVPRQRPAGGPLVGPGEVVADPVGVVVADPADTVVVESADTVVDYDALTPEGFEEAIAALCERDGCSSVEVVGGAGDLGADVLAVTPDGRRTVVQCKQYGETNRVGSQDLQRFGGTCFTVHGADLAVLVTTSDFTAPALEYAEQCGILCVNREALLAWTDGTGPSPWETVPGLPATGAVPADADLSATLPLDGPQGGARHLTAEGTGC